MQFKYFITEKLLPSEFRKIVKLWKESGVKERFDDVFGEKDRLYEPYKGKDIVEDNPTAEAIEDFLETYPGHDYRLKDYKKGLVVNKSTGRELRIMKALDSLSKQIEKELEGDMNTRQRQFREVALDTIDRLKKAFQRDDSRLKTAGLMVCYSRHAYDIAGMSTDRGWRSCMRLANREDPNPGVNAHLVPIEAKTGTLVAYLIRNNDKNIKNPLGRILIKPFLNTNNREEIYMVPCTGGYGTVPREFIEQVINWSKQLNKNVKFGKYTLPSDLEDTDVPFDTVRHLPDDITDLVKTNDFKMIDTLQGLVDNYKEYRYDNYKDKFGNNNIGWKKKLIFNHDKIMKDFTEKKFVALLDSDFDTAEKVLPILSFISKRTKVDKAELLQKMYKEKEKRLPF